MQENMVTSFSDKKGNFLDKDTATDLIYLDPSKTSDMVPYGK